LQPFLFFHSALVNPKAHIPYDIQGFHQPQVTQIARSLRQGDFPLWDPNIYCGYPIHADVQAAIFYPFTWIPVLLRNLSTRGDTTLFWLQWDVVLHLMLAGVFTYWLLRRMGAGRGAAVFGGTAFQLGCFFASLIHHVGAVCASTWLPLAWLALWELKDRIHARWIALLAASLSMAFLAGFMASTLVVYTAAGCFTLALFLANPKQRWRLLPAALLGAAASFVLVAVQLGPTYELTQISMAKERGDWYHGGGSPVNSWCSIFAPNCLHVFEGLNPDIYKEQANFTFMYLYNGLGTAVLSLLAFVLRSPGRIVAPLALLFLCLFSGDKIPGVAELFQRLPHVVQGALYAEYFIAAFSFAAAVAAALALQSLNRPKLAWILALATGAELIGISSNRSMNSAPGSWKHEGSEDKVDSDPAPVRILNRLVQNGGIPPNRIDVLDLNFQYTMGGDLRGFQSPAGDNPFAPERVIAMRRGFTTGESWVRNVWVTRPESPWLDFLNLGVLVAETAEVDNERMRQAGWDLDPQKGRYRHYVNREVMPRFFLVGQVRPAGSAAEALKLAESSNLRSVAIVEGPAPPQAESAGEVRVTRYTPNAIELTTTSEGRSYLVTSETAFPGWRAFVDGQEAPIRLTNYAFRGLAIPAGSHRVRMVFDPPLFKTYAAISAMGWIATFSLLLPLGRRRAV
jgi:hypothetical protein